ncbi:MAG: hypothetical protein WC209_16775 [Ignavibacteriaceae bacterium]
MKLSSIFLIMFLLVGCNLEKETPTGVQVTHPIQSPQLSVGIGIEGGGWRLSWSNSGDGCNYELEENGSDDFSFPFLIYQGNDRYLALKTGGMFYRVRASFGGEKSEWSNIVQAHLTLIKE